VTELAGVNKEKTHSVKNYAFDADSERQHGGSRSAERTFRAGLFVRAFSSAAVMPPAAADPLPLQHINIARTTTTSRSSIGGGK